ncbi:MAG: hypothetical protein ABSH04_03580 [Acidimicrobiales bacterium]|jgi:hypothetical protein
MTLGKRCDEIVRLIDKTLCDLATGDDDKASRLETDSIELEFPEDEPGRVQAHERLCIVGRPAPAAQGPAPVARRPAPRPRRRPAGAATPGVGNT